MGFPPRDPRDLRCKTIRLPADVIRRLEEWALKNRTTFSEEVRIAIDARIESQPDAPRHTAGELPDDSEGGRKTFGGELTKQVTVTYDAKRYVLIRDEAIRRGVSVSTLLREWVDPQLDKLPTRC